MTSKQEDVLHGKRVSKKNKYYKDKFNNFFDKIKNGFQDFEWDDNVQRILGIALLLVGLWRLRAWILGLIMIIVGMLLLIGYFDKR